MTDEEQFCLVFAEHFCLFDMTLRTKTVPKNPPKKHCFPAQVVTLVKTLFAVHCETRQ